MQAEVSRLQGEIAHLQQTTSKLTKEFSRMRHLAHRRNLTTAHPRRHRDLKAEIPTERDGYNALFEELFGRHLEGHNKDEIRDALAAYFDRLTAHHG